MTMTVVTHENMFQTIFDKVWHGMQAIEDQQQTNPVPITTIIREWIADETSDDNIVVDLREQTVTGEHLTLEPPAKGRKTLTISNGTLEVAEGIRVKSLKGLTMENVTIKGRRMGVILRDSKVEFRNCSITSKGTLAVSIDSNVHFEKCQLCNSESGDGLVVMGSHGSTSAQSCDFEGNTGSGVRVLRCGQINLKDCTLKGSKTSVGMAVTGSGCKASVVSCEFLENQRNGIAVAEGSLLEMEDCVIQDTKEFHGLTVQDTSTVVIANQCDIIESDQCGVFVAEGATAILKECVVKGSRSSSGVSVQGHGTKLDAMSCEFIDNQQCAIVVAGGACCLLNGCVGKRSGDLYGLGVSGSGTRVEARGCHFSHNQLCGVYVHDGARVHLERCVARGGKSSEGLSSAGFVLGANVLCDSKLPCQRNTFGSWNRNGVEILEGATATLTECVSRMGGINGMTVSGGNTAAVAKKCDLGGESRDPRLEDAFSTMF